jgi:branched-chain amino acid transport system permease protein
MNKLKNIFTYNLREHFATWWENSTKFQRTLFRIILIALCYALPYLRNPIIDTPQSSFDSILFYPLVTFVILSIGLNIVVGKSGILDLGFVAFYAIGAYSMAILGTLTNLNFWEILPIGMALAMLSGVILGLPALRLRGDYLAIITLGFGEIVRIVAINVEITGGSQGIYGIPTPPSIFGIEFSVTNIRPYYWLMLTFVLLIIWAFLRLTSRRPGRAWEAIREDEDVAELMGVPTLKYKLWAFILGGAVGGAGGVVYASQVSTITPELFKVNVSFLILACVVFGGMGNLWGVVLGAILLNYIPEKIRFLADTRIVLFGVLMVLMMNLRPNGLVPRMKREKVYDKKTGKEVAR